MFSAALYAHVHHFYTTAHETAGAARIRHSLRPLNWRRAKNTCKPRAHRAARTRPHVEIRRGGKAKRAHPPGPRKMWWSRFAFAHPTNCELRTTNHNRYSD